MKLRVARKVWLQEYGDGCSGCLQTTRDWRIYRQSTLDRARRRRARAYPRLRLRDRPFLQITLPQLMAAFPRIEPAPLLVYDPQEQRRLEDAMRFSLERMRLHGRERVFVGFDLGIPGAEPVTIIDARPEGGPLTPEIIESVRQAYGGGGYSISGVVAPPKGTDKP